MLTPSWAWECQVFEKTNQREAYGLLLKLCEWYDSLPTSLFVTGIRRLDHDATFGGGFSDVYRACRDGQVVALKRLRVFLRDQERQTFHRVNNSCSVIGWMTYLFNF
jgi:hypothetical protein